MAGARTATAASPAGVGPRVPHACFNRSAMAPVKEGGARVEDRARPAAPTRSAPIRPSFATAAQARPDAEPVGSQTARAVLIESARVPILYVRAPFRTPSA